MRLHVKPFAAAFGITWGLTLWFISLWIWLLDGKKNKPIFLSSLYRGYKTGPIGGLIGLAWGLIDGAIGGGMFACLYNLLSSKSKQKIEIEV